MINCPICSVVNDDSARFCAECGQRLQADPAPAGMEPGFKVEETIVTVATSTETVPTPEVVPTPLATPPVSEETKPTMIPPKPAKKLHSPLLKPEADWDVEEEEPAPTSKKGRSLRSPILGGGEPAYDYDAADEFASKHKGLRSPLLGGGDVEPPQHRFVGEPAPTRPGHLHSPLLDSTYDEYDDFIDDFETVEDPNVLRSPLLAAKVPMHSHSHEPATPTPEPVEPVSSVPPVSALPQPTPAPIPVSAPAPTPAPTLSAPAQAPVTPPPAMPPSSEIKPTFPSSPIDSSKSFPTSGVGQLPHPTKVGMSSPTGLKSSLLGSQEDDEYESSRYAPPPNYQPDQGMSSIIRMFVWPLALSACVRLWVMAEYARGGQLYPAVIAGELSHLVVIAFLILVAINYPPGGRSNN